MRAILFLLLLTMLCFAGDEDRRTCTTCNGTGTTYYWSNGSERSMRCTICNGAGTTTRRRRQYNTYQYNNKYNNTTTNSGGRWRYNYNTGQYYWSYY